MPDTAALSARRVPPVPVNEPVLGYAPGSPERAELKARLSAMSEERPDIPLIIGGEDVRSGDRQQAVMPFAHRHVLADWSMAEPAHVQKAIDAARDAAREWGAWPWEDRAAVFLRAAHLAATRYRADAQRCHDARTGQDRASGEIDAACELVDFWRFNVSYATELYSEQPISAPAPGTNWTTVRSRGSSTQSRRSTSRLSQAISRRTSPDGRRGDLEAGLDGNPQRTRHHAGPHGRLVCLQASSTLSPGNPAKVSDQLLGSRDLAGVHFTGSTGRVQSCGARSAATSRATATIRVWSARRAARTSSSCIRPPDAEEVAVAIVRGGFEYQGQKCSAPSRDVHPAFALARRSAIASVA
jgi:1-pyrroline-5-carboxylate dehydrogenase